MRTSWFCRRVGSTLCFRRQLRQSSVRRIHNKRRASRPDSGCTPIEPKVVVEARCAIFSPVHLVTRRGHLRGPSQQTRIPIENVLFETGRLLLCQEFLIRLIPRAFERRDRAVVPDTLQVRVPPWHPDPGRRLRGREQRRDRHRGDGEIHDDVTSTDHLILLTQRVRFRLRHPTPRLRRLHTGFRCKCPDLPTHHARTETGAHVLVEHDNDRPLESGNRINRRSGPTGRQRCRRQQELPSAE